MVEVSWVDSIMARVCTFEGSACLGVEDAIATGAGGLAAGAVAVWVYMWRKNGEYVDRRNDMARIQANEVADNMDILGLERRRERRVSGTPRAPTMRVYEGLLSSGNIRYLGDELQELLAQVHHDLMAHPLDPNAGLHERVLERLNEIVGSRDRHFTMLPLWMWRARRRLRKR